MKQYKKWLVIVTGIAVITLAILLLWLPPMEVLTLSLIALVILGMGWAKWDIFKHTVEKVFEEVDGYVTSIETSPNWKGYDFMLTQIRREFPRLELDEFEKSACEYKKKAEEHLDYVKGDWRKEETIPYYNFYEWRDKGIGKLGAYANDFIESESTVKRLWEELRKIKKDFYDKSESVKRKIAVLQDSALPPVLIRDTVTFAKKCLYHNQEEFEASKTVEQMVSHHKILEKIENELEEVVNTMDLMVGVAVPKEPRLIEVMIATMHRLLTENQNI